MREERIEVAGSPSIAVGEPDAPLRVVLLHGFAMTPADLAPFAHSLGLPARFYFPEGPVAAALVPGEPRGRAWWHIDPAARLAALARGPRDFAALEPPDLPAARALLGGIVDELGGAGPLVVGGFSSGGMLAWDLQLRAPRPIAGLVLLSSTRIAWREEEARVRAAPLAGLPAFQSHGKADDDLAYAAGEALRDAVAAAGAELTWLPFDGGHEIPLVVWRRLRKWLAALVRYPPSLDQDMT
jgi:phospholipase/carboxylesterase